MIVWKYSLYEETSEIEVVNFDLNVPWAQQAEKKSLNVGYKKQTIFLEIYMSFWLDLQYYWVLAVDISGITGFEKLAMHHLHQIMQPKSRRRTNEHAFWKLEAVDEICFHGKIKFLFWKHIMVWWFFKV